MQSASYLEVVWGWGLNFKSQTKLAATPLLKEKRIH